MKIVIFNGSPHENGNTAALCKAFTDALPPAVQVETLSLYSILPLPCTACGACMQKNCCSFSDLDETDALLHEADAFVWAVPIYNYSVPAPVKALLDRFQRYYEAVRVRGEPVFDRTDRPAVLLLTAGRQGLYSKEMIEKQLQTAGDSIGFSLLRTVFAARTDCSPPSEEVLEASHDAAVFLLQKIGFYQ